MFYQKLTHDEKQKLFDKYVRIRNKLDVDPFIISWKTWLKKPYAEKQPIIKAWEDYYANVKKSVIYAIFMEMRQKSFKSDWGGVRELAQQVRKMEEDGVAKTTDLPKSIDPWEFSHNPKINAYLKAEEGIRDMGDSGGGVDEIFDDSNGAEVVQ